MHERLAPLRLPAFRRLLAAYFVGKAGDWFGEVALSVVVLKATGSVVAVTLLWVAATFVPAAIGPMLASKVRGHGIRQVLVAARLAEAGLFATLAITAAAGAPLALTLVLAMLDGILNIAASGLTKAAIVCTTRPAGLHKEANALVNLAFTIAFAAGPALAGLLVSAVGASSALVLDAASFVLAALAIARVNAIPVLDDPRDTEPWLGQSVLRLLRQPRLRSLLLADGVSAVFFAMIIPVELVFVTRTLGGTAADFGIVLAAWGAGAVIGGSTLVRCAHLDGRALVAGSFALMIVGYLGMGTATSIATVVAFSCLGGVGNGVQGGALMTLTQEQAPDSDQPALNGLLESLHTAAPGLGYVIGGMIAATATPRTTYAVAGIGALGVLIWLAQTLWARAQAEPASVPA